MRNKSENIHLRCQPEIKLIAKIRAAELGMSLSDLFTESILSPDYVVVSKNPKLHDFNLQLSAIGRNLNQMVRAMNSINQDSKQFHDINLYMQNPEFRSIAEQLDGLINDFQKFNQRFSASEKELCKVVSSRVLFSDVEEMLSDNPELLKMLRSRRDT